MLAHPSPHTALRTKHSPRTLFLLSSPTPTPDSHSLPEWLGFGAKFARANLEGPHDMESVRASIVKKRFNSTSFLARLRRF